MQKRMTVEPEKHKDELDYKDSEAHDSCSKFQYHSLTQTIFEIDPI